MAYELNLTAAQYEAVYEINLDYLMSLNGHADVFGIWWDRRNADLRFVLTPWQYDKYVALNHFYRPVAWKAGGWTFAVYAHYNRGHFYNAHPKVFVSYKGGHNKVHGSHYAHMGKPAPAPVAKHNPAPMPDRGARVMNDKGHNMGNHSNAHKAPNREFAMNTRNCSTICLETRTPGDLRNEVPFFAERICGFVDYISVVLMESVLLHLKF